MGRRVPVPPPAARAWRRAERLDQADDRVFEAWVVADVPLTFSEWCEFAWEVRKPEPPPPPPNRLTKY